MSFNDFFSGPLFSGDLFDWVGNAFGNASDYFTGYTTANQANRFLNQNMDRQQAYNRENMSLEDTYLRNLMRDSPSIQRSALQAAGYNPLLAISGGISSPNSAAHASLPSASSPPVNSRFGDLLNSASSIFGLTGAFSDFLRLENESKVADAQVDNIKADTELKAAKVLTEPSVKNSVDAKTMRDQVNTITDAVGTTIPLASSAAGAYAAKKSANVAMAAIRSGMTKESAKAFAKDVVGHSPATSAATASSMLGLLGSRILPSLGFGYGVYEASKGRKTDVWKDNQKTSHRQALHGWH